MTFELNKDWSNWVKLGAALMVAFGHYSNYALSSLHSTNLFYQLMYQTAAIGVSIFFFFSGYGLMESEKKHHMEAKEFFKRRFFKIYLPVLMVSAFWIPISYFWLSKQPVTWNAETLEAFTWDIVWGFRDCVLWFVKILFLLYALFWVSAKLRYKGQSRLSDIIMIGGTLFATWLAYYMKYPSISVPFFGIGVYSSLCKDRQLAKIPFSIVMITCLAILFMCCYFAIRDNYLIHGVIDCICTVVAIGSVYMLKNTPPSHFIKHLCISNIHYISCSLQSIGGYDNKILTRKFMALAISNYNSNHSFY